jgi:hypothetical protein
MNDKFLSDADAALHELDVEHRRKEGLLRIKTELQGPRDDLLDDLAKGNRALRFLDMAVRDLEEIHESDLTVFEKNFMRHAREILR